MSNKAKKKARRLETLNARFENTIVLNRWSKSISKKLSVANTIAEANRKASKHTKKDK